MRPASQEHLDVALLLFAAAVILSLLAATAPKNKGHHQLRGFVQLLTCILAALVSQVVFFLADGNPALGPVTYVSSLMTILLGALVCVLYLRCLCSFVKAQTRTLEKVVHGIAIAYGLVCVIVILTLPTGLFFYVDQDGVYCDGPLYWLIKGIFFSVNLIVLALVFRYRKSLPIKDRSYLWIFGLFLTLASVSAHRWYPTPEYAVATVSCVLLYSFFQEELLWQLTESKISMTLSQMQPHFMYNVLNSIYYLCQRDPQQAQDAIDKFSDYLRNNMGSLEQTELIPFEQEYRHIQTYLSLEQIRFRNLSIQYDIEATNFLLPPLTVQPLVENAVKHGVTKKRGGGTVTISTRQTKTHFLIAVQDTGVGFDPDNYSQDGRLHVGISNVRLRLEHMIGGKLTITSQPGRGTEAVISIPMKEGTPT